MYWKKLRVESSIIFAVHCSVAQSCPTLCNPVDCSTPGFPVLLLSRCDESTLIMTSNQR